MHVTKTYFNIVYHTGHQTKKALYTGGESGHVSPVSKESWMISPQMLKSTRGTLKTSNTGHFNTITVKM